MSEKVRVEVDPDSRKGVHFTRQSPYGHESHYVVQFKMVLPFFQSSPGKYVHRVRHAHSYINDGEYSHTAVHYWCGGTGFNNQGNERRHSQNKRGRFLAEPPQGEVCCATCEGRAVGAGLAGAPVICGHPVKFQPRH